ncbi:MAG: MATE family efflux transporter [Novosphingobium sp.]
MPGLGRSTPFRAELGATLLLAGPLALANMLQMAVYSTDVIFVARLGQQALAASSLAVALFGIIVWGLQGLTSAVAPLIAAELGQRRHSVREIRRSVRMALWLAVLGGTGGVGVCLAGESIMLLSGQPPALAAAAGGFVRLLAIAVIPLVIGNVLRIFVAAMGRPGVATVVTAMAVVVNALGNWALIFGHLGMPALGLRGSALASIVTSFAMLAAYAVTILRDRRLRRFHVLGHWWRPELRRLGEVVRLGAPIGLTVVAEGGLFSGAAFLMGRIGEEELAAHAIALQVAAFFFQLPFGIGQAATIRVGYHFGAGDAPAIGRAGRAALVTGLICSGVSSAAMLFVPRLILSAYVDSDAPENAALVALAVRFLLVAAAFQFFDGLQAIAAGSLRGLQDTRVPMIIAIAGYWLGGFATAAGLGLATPLGGLGVWIGLAVGLVLVAGLLLSRWGRRARLRLLPRAGPSSR